MFWSAFIGGEVKRWAEGDHGKLRNQLHPCVLAGTVTQDLISRMHRSGRQTLGWHFVFEKNFKEITTNNASVIRFWVKSLWYPQGKMYVFQNFKSYLCKCVEIRGQLGEASSLLLPCGFWEQTQVIMWQEPLTRLVTALAQGKRFLSLLRKKKSASALSCQLSILSKRCTRYVSVFNTAMLSDQDNTNLETATKWLTLIE